ncbi:MAG: hypothetical protein HN737_10070 [Desulfobacterales bacterium]|jgi:hypothetical protein|nr:hypothetical protein [Desulfobacteraceae bacterium]MBT4365152.1 hypothetical protein [Desulfobacteraceae bacterium]MBT7085099.1 hypothetical protein [Desulfobacterales bacterium]MBT7697740.1 hypothetical protein [Desulfobacterales bacterium]
MSEVKFELKGWQAVVAVVVLIGIVAVRIMPLSDMKRDKELMKDINKQLLSEYAPHVSEKVQSAYDTGDEDKLSKAVDSATSTKVNIHSVKASYPIFNFSTSKEVVVKVEFSLDDSSGKGKKKIIYYLFRNGILGWTFQHETTVASYYLNFM